MIVMRIKLFPTCTWRTKSIMTMLLPWLCQVNEHFVTSLCVVIILSSMTHCLSLAVSQNFEQVQTNAETMFVCVESLYSHFAVCNESITAVSHVCSKSLVRVIPITFYSAFTLWSVIFGLYQVFLSNWEHSGKHCHNSSPAGPLAVCKKSAKGLWKVDKDSLQSNYPVLGLSMPTPSELTELLTIM